MSFIFLPERYQHLRLLVSTLLRGLGVCSEMAVFAQQAFLEIVVNLRAIWEKLIEFHIGAFTSKIMFFQLECLPHLLGISSGEFLVDFHNKPTLHEWKHTHWTAFQEYRNIHTKRAVWEELWAIFQYLGNKHKFTEETTSNTTVLL